MPPISKCIRRVYNVHGDHYYRPVFVYADGKSLPVKPDAYKSVDVPDKTSITDYMDIIERAMDLLTPSRLGDVIKRHRSSERLLSIVQDMAPDWSFIHLLAD